MSFSRGSLLLQSIQLTGLDNIRDRRKIANVAGLMMGYGAGQGALFIAQTELVARGQLSFLGAFGAAFTVVTLLYQVVDCGGLVVLAREVLRTGLSQAERSEIFWAFSATRTVLAFVILLAFVALFCFFGPKFWTSFLLASSLGMLAFASNPGGLLDGLSLSGWTGLTSAIPFIATACVLPYAGNFSSDGVRGAALGVAYSTGSIACVAFQFLVLRFSKFSLTTALPRIEPGLMLLREGAVFLLGWAPGQLFFRGQIAICSLLFGSAATGLLIYSKQIVVSGTQVLFFVRRAEFPKLVHTVASSEHVVIDALFVQRTSLYLAVIGTLAYIALAFVFRDILSVRFEGAALLLLAFSPSLLTNALLGIVMQLSAAIRRLRYAAETNIFVTLLGGLCAAAIFAKLLGLWGFAVAEFLINVLAAATIVWRISSESKKAQGLPAANTPRPELTEP